MLANQFPNQYTNLLDPVKSLAVSQHERQHLFELTQTALSKLLVNFMNGDMLTQSGALFFPVSSSCRRVDTNLMALVGIAHTKYQLLPESAVLAEKLSPMKVLTRRDYAKLIAVLYKELYEHTAEFNTIEKNRLVRVPKDYSEWYREANQYPYMRFATLFKEKLACLQQYTKGIYFHGSVATLDFVENWSDLDNLIILRKEVVTNEELLIQAQRKLFGLKRYIYQFDPLQHHGHIIITELEMDFYPRSFFPVEILENAVCCYGKSELNFSIRNDHQERIISTIGLVRNICNIKRTALTNAYILKAYMSSLMLLPSLYLQLNGTYCYKRESFHLAKDDFKEDWAAIDRASHLRRKWKSVAHGVLPRRAFLMLPNPNAIKIFYYFVDKLPTDISNEINSLVNETQYFIDRLISLMEKKGYLDDQQ